MVNVVTNAQKQIEGQNFDTRKNLLDYDDVLAKQRQIIYDHRDRILLADDITDMIHDYFKTAGMFLAKKAVMTGRDEGLISGESLKRLVEPAFMEPGTLPVSAYDEAPVEEAGEDLGESLYAIYLKRIAYHAGKARIYANSGYMGQGGVGFIELIHFLGECHDALIRVLCIERGEFHASHKEFLHFEGVVLRHFFSNDSLHFFLNSSIIDVYIIFVQYFFDFALWVLSVFFYQFHSH